MKKATKLKKQNPSPLFTIFEYINARKKLTTNENAILFWNNLKTMIINSDLREDSSFNDLKKLLRVHLALMQGTIRELERLEDRD